MGFSKRLDHGQSSFETVSAGTTGWRSAELLLKHRCTKAVDLFAVGCIMYYILTNGQHPFGEWIERDSNIVRGRPDTSGLSWYVYKKVNEQMREKTGISYAVALTRLVSLGMRIKK